MAVEPQKSNTPRPDCLAEPMAGQDSIPSADRPRAWLCWSSGKDSAWALHVARQQGDVEVVGLLTSVTEPYARVSMHGVREEVLEAQAKAAGLPLFRVPIPDPCSNEVYRAAMGKAVAEARRQGVTRMVFGDLFLEDVRDYRRQQLAGSGIEPVFPLWARPTGLLAREMIAAGLVAHVTCLDPRRLPRTLAGRRFDLALLAELPPEVDPCAERGEFHTCAIGGPMFQQPLPIELGETLDRGGYVFTDLKLSGEKVEPGPCSSAVAPASVQGSTRRAG